MNKEPIPVVCALIERDGHVLVAQRPAHKHLALKWEFPGGKIEPGESPESALVREIKEELACNIILTRALPHCTHDYGPVTIEMFPFVCRLTPDSPAPHPREHTELRWVKPEMLPTLDLATADRPIAAHYLKSGRRPR
ncbi:MAG: (deoxy)nucleoside triphosphate pyrophosphohydrolase [Opitutaceae bacterium]|nr:(deoxy)nucleoside triphosphate pyrophosphohydrolase [Opitutaceae bacterium]